MKRSVRPFYIPFSLPINQVKMIFSFAELTSWKKLYWWAIQSPKLFTTAAGAKGIGCFGYPSHPVFEITNNCNLKCSGCHANGGENLFEEMNTDEAKKVINGLAEIDDFRTIVFTGGEPFLRKDFFELIRYAKSLGFYPIIASNGTLLSKEIVSELKRLGVTGVAISIDSVKPEKHDLLRGMSGCFDKVMKGIDILKSEGLYIQANITISKTNYMELEELLKLSNNIPAQVVLLYQFIPTGRGSNSKEITLNKDELFNVIKKTYSLQKNLKPVINPIGLPEYWAYIFAKNRNIKLKSIKKFFPGCVAGKGMFYIKPNGDVWPCAFLPVKAGNILSEKPIDVWEKSKVFLSLRDRKNITGKCGECKYIDVCGGCRARAYAFSGDYLGEDPLCPLKIESLD
jgi:radical SAM protein with 4Fe4S-binding SPASM domain